VGDSLTEEGAMRHLVLVGKVFRNPKTVEIAHRCAWCRRWASTEDMIAAHKHGARVSHGMCKSCARKFEAEYNDMPPNAA
jgi:hypothetical protein